MANRRRPADLTDESLYADLHEQGLRNEDVTELGPTTRDQGGLFERMRTRLSHGHVLSSTFDVAVKSRVGTEYCGNDLPDAVDVATFEKDLLTIQSMDPEQIEVFDQEVCDAKMERRAEGGGFYVNPQRACGYGPDVFGIAYDVKSKKWLTTNELGLHANCKHHLLCELEPDDADSCIFSGFIFKLPSLETPIMIPFGYVFMDPKEFSKGISDLWEWKRFIILTQLEVEKGRYRYCQIVTPEHALGMCQD